MVAARRDMLKRAMDAVQGAGLRLVGIDHSAFGLIRALSREATGRARVRVRRPRRVLRPDGRRPDGGDGARPGAGAPMPAAQEQAQGLQPPADPGLGVSPAGRVYCNLGDVTNLAVTRGDVLRLHPLDQLRRRGHGPVARRTRRPRARPRSKVAGPRRPPDPGRGDRGRRRDRRQVAGEVLTTGTAKLGDELRTSLEYYAALEDAVRVESMVIAGIGTTIPGLVDALRGQLPAADRGRDPGGPERCRRRRRRSADALLRPRAGGVKTCAR